MLNKEFYTTKELVELFGINRQSLHRWRKEGIVKYQIIGKRKFIYKKSDIEALLGNSTKQENKNKKNVIYCRVSNQKQKQDLLKQKQILLDFCNSNGYVVDEIYCEIASGMNENRIESH
jgi:predicted site-specific integrase-resolvase